MRLCLTTLFLLAATAGAQAQGNPYCEELWVARNTLFDRAGFCFGSQLGQDVFDNSNCTTSDPVLAQVDADAVADMHELEQRIGCNIDTSQYSWPSIRAMADRLAGLAHIPTLDELESACIGYLDAPIPLRSGATEDSPIIGWIQTGNTVGFSHWPREEWQFVTAAAQPGAPVSAWGWMNVSFSDSSCRLFAG